MKNWIKYLEQEEGKQVVSHEDGLIAYYQDGRDLVLTNLFVAEEARGNNVALMLARQVEQRAVAMGCTQLVCHIHLNKSNVKMFPRKVELFSKFGFVANSTHNNITEMIKNLTGE